jgi:hypothetical protein
MVLTDSDKTIIGIEFGNRFNPEQVRWDCRLLHQSLFKVIYSKQVKKVKAAFKEDCFTQ